MSFEDDVQKELELLKKVEEAAEFAREVIRKELERLKKEGK